MKRVLLTGMAGTGKSTLIGEFAARGPLSLYDVRVPASAALNAAERSDGLSDAEIDSQAGVVRVQFQ